MAQLADPTVTRQMLAALLKGGNIHPHFSDIRGQYPALFQDAEGCMRLFVWHRYQKAVSHCLTAILNRAQNVNTDSCS